MQTDPLKDLRDIHLPEPGGFWPPAPGWWLLAAVVLALVIGLAIWLWRRRRRNAWLRQARRELDDINAMPGSEGQKLKQLNLLLKRAARARYPERRPEALTGDSWVAFLMETGRHNRSSDEPLLLGLVESSWRPGATVPFGEAEQAARSWLRAQSC
ncbi:DUF4381 domain-containing protein [Marinobacter salicampi]|uniref:DUF4381 domain-containing protein n=1 Tax=Marinobacter salicampi TaxID=435907 RepID=UPI0014074200|nr:DUF4381 domain-containing protein [Marinobacter salicampi]